MEDERGQDRKGSRLNVSDSLTILAILAILVLLTTSVSATSSCPAGSAYPVVCKCPNGKTERHNTKDSFMKARVDPNSCCSPEGKLKNSRLNPIPSQPITRPPTRIQSIPIPPKPEPVIPKEPQPKFNESRKPNINKIPIEEDIKFTSSLNVKGTKDEDETVIPIEIQPGDNDILFKSSLTRKGKSKDLNSPITIVAHNPVTKTPKSNNPISTNPIKNTANEVIKEIEETKKVPADNSDGSLADWILNLFGL